MAPTRSIRPTRTGEKPVVKCSRCAGLNMDRLARVGQLSAAGSRPPTRPQRTRPRAVSSNRKRRPATNTTVQQSAVLYMAIRRQQSPKTRSASPSHDRFGAVGDALTRHASCNYPIERRALGELARPSWARGPGELSRQLAPKEPAPSDNFQLGPSVALDGCNSSSSAPIQTRTLRARGPRKSPTGLVDEEKIHAIIKSGQLICARSLSLTSSYSS